MFLMLLFGDPSGDRFHGDVFFDKLWFYVCSKKVNSKKRACLGFGFSIHVFNVDLNLKPLSTNMHVLSSLKKSMFKQLVWSTLGAPNVKYVDGGLVHDLENVSANDRK